MKIKLALLIIFVVALFLRVYRLETIPYGFHADEARAAWGALSIVSDGRDDLGHFLPLYYDSFGDQRPTGIFYANIPFILAFGKTIMASRLASALAGALSVIAIYWLTFLTTSNKRIGLFSATLLALMPWHVVTSRSGDEVIIAGCFIVFGLALWILGLQNKKLKWLLISILLGVLSCFFYHTARLLVPAFWMICYIFYALKDKTVIKIIILLLMLVGLFFVSAESRGRFSQVSIFSSQEIKLEFVQDSIEEGNNNALRARIFHNKIILYTKAFIEEYFNYFSGGFLIGNDALPKRYVTPGFGLISYGDLLLFLSGIVFAIRKGKKYGILFFLLILSPLVAAVTKNESPNINRALFMVFYISIFEGIGLAFLMEKFAKQKLILILIYFIYFGHWVYFSHNYLIHTPKSVLAYDRNAGSYELAKKIVETNNNYDSVYLTDTPDELIPWIGFAGKWKPKVFNSQAQTRKQNNNRFQIDNIFFTRERCPASKIINPKNNSLLVDAEGCLKPVNTPFLNYKIEFVINRLDMSTVYTAWRVNNMAPNQQSEK